MMLILMINLRKKTRVMSKNMQKTRGESGIREKLKIVVAFCKLK